ncbi:MAG: DMT family transporter [Actinomycetota bacterium]
MDRRYLLVVVAAALWALIGVWATELDEAGLSATGIGAWRAVVGGTCFVAHAAVVGRLGEARRLRPGLVVALAALGVTLFYVALPAAASEGGVSLAWVLLYTAPAFVAIAAWLWLGERLGAIGVGLVVATLFGVALVILPDSEGITVSGASLGWGLAAGFGYAAYSVISKVLVASAAPVVVLAVALPLGALPLLPVLGLPTGARTWALLLGLGIGSTYLPYLAYATALRHVEAVRASVVASVEPLLAVAIAVVVYDESLHPVAFVGAAVVVSAAVVAVAQPATSDAKPASI